MIQICYYKQGQADSPLPSSVYHYFGLEPGINPQITKNCPELESQTARRQLVEYGCCLWHWRNQKELPSKWIGLTSFRQQEKTNTFFTDSVAINDIIEQRSIATWGLCKMVDQNNQPISLSTQANACHPGIEDFIHHVYDYFGLSVPHLWFSTSTGIFANYWAMHRDDFISYMDFSWPIVQYALSQIGVHEYTTKPNRFRTVTEEKSVGYFIERLFILWYLENHKITENLGRVMTIRNKVAA